jgi:hypothetical protein
MREDRSDGPMASGILSVLYARLGDKDKAYDYFVKSYKPNSRLFWRFSESIIVTIRILLQGLEQCYNSYLWFWRCRTNG